MLAGQRLGGSVTARLHPAHSKHPAAVFRLTELAHAGRPEGWAAALLRACAPHVPASAPAVRPPPALQAALLALNMAAAALLARFLPAAAAGSHQVRPTRHAHWQGC